MEKGREEVKQKRRARIFRVVATASILVGVYITTVGVQAIVAAITEQEVAVYAIPPLFKDSRAPDGRKTDGHACWNPVRDELVFFGGSDASGSDYRVWVIDPRTWDSQPTALRVPVHGLGAVGCTEKGILIVGGATSTRESAPTAAVHWLDYRTWSAWERPGLRLANPLLDTAGVWMDGEEVMMAVGGSTDDHKTDSTTGSQYQIRFVDPIRGKSAVVGTLTHPLDEAGVAWNPDRQVAYVVGGHGRGEFRPEIREVLSNGLNRVVGTLPVGMDNLVAVYESPYVYVLGGRAPGELGDGSDTIYRWDSRVGGMAVLMEARLLHPTWATAYAVRRLPDRTEVAILTDSKYASQLVVIR